MNKITSRVTKNDWSRSRQRRRGAWVCASEILENLQQAEPFGLTFVENIPEKHREEIEAKLKEKFELWANSWIAPLCREILAKKIKTDSRLPENDTPLR